jgi:hypothetical protein
MNMGRFIMGDLRQKGLPVLCCARPSSRFFFQRVSSLPDPLDQAILAGGGFLSTFLELRPEPSQGSLHVGETRLFRFYHHFEIELAMRF